MKKLISLLCVLVLVLSLTACGAKQEKTELTVFAAASMTETMQQIADLYAKDHPDVTITYTFDSSGTLKTQIAEGAQCDLFISAAQKQMDALSELGLIDEDTRRDILENKVALVVPDGNPAGIESFNDILSDKLSLLTIGNSDVPVGQYTLDIFDYLGVTAQELESEGKLTYGTNVKEVTTQVSESAADAGIVYATDAFSANLQIVDEATPEMTRQIIYPAAVLKASKNADAAKELLAFLQTDEAMTVFEAVGFAPVS
ncbi:MAG: molybdate ABC transporter substrate-binding protein [Oscillospiraceae bacterium]